MPRPTSLALAIAIALVLSTNTLTAYADVDTESEDRSTDFGRLQVVGSAERAQSLPGSAHYIGEDDLARFDYSDIHRILRQVPGLYLIDEEGFGLRPNIGMRGSGTDRAGRITLLEDGVLVAPAPYSNPAAYYFPSTARMRAVEVRKGSVSVKHGPYTAGGAINLLSTRIPEAASGQVRATTGSFGTHEVHAYAGGRKGGLGWLMETVQQRSDGFKRLDFGGDTGYSLQDYQFKLAWSSQGPYDQDFELRLGGVEHNADETYVGLTSDDFLATPHRRYAGSRLDNIDTTHRQIQLRHALRTNGALDFTTVIYRNTFARNWYKLQAVGGRGLSAILANPAGNATELAWLRGDADSPDGALVLRANNREYLSAGVQHIIAWSGQSGPVAHDLEIGIRLHRDEEDRFQWEDGYRMQGGRLVLTSMGAPGSQENRLGTSDVVAVFVEDEMTAGAWTVTPGVRFERIRGLRRDYDRMDPDPSRPGGPIQVRAETHEVWIPGVGVSHAAGSGLTLFGAVHKGFTPPSPGSPTDPEESLNWEFGVRYAAGGLRGELVGFYNDYDNLVGTCTASTGGGCNIGDQFDGGKVRVHGVEVLASCEMLSGPTFSMPIGLSYTWTKAEFRSAFNSGFGEWGNVQVGDRLPYLPRHQGQLTVGLARQDWALNLNISWMDEMRTRAGQGPAPRTERTDAYTVVDLAGNYRLADGFELFGRVDNLLGKDYIVAWRPSGARPGKPRGVYGGFRWAF